MALTARKLNELRKRPVGQTGNRLADAIELSGETQAAISETLGFSQAYVSDVARGRYSNVTLPNARKFAGHFGCTVDDLFPAQEAAIA